MTRERAAGRIHLDWRIASLLPVLVGTLAIVATGTAIGMSVLAGWQRGGWLPERVAWVAVGVVLVVSVHLLPALCRRAPARVRWMGAILWAASMVAACYGHATFFLLAQQHAGERRAAAVMPDVTAPLPEIAPAVRSLPVIMAERASATAVLAAANARRCADNCPVLRSRRVSLVARLEALETEADEARRKLAADERRAADRQYLAAMRDAARDDPVTARLAGLFATTGTRVELLSGLAFAGVLEGVACLLWFLVLQPPARTDVVMPDPVATVTTGNGAVAPGLPAVTPDSRDWQQSEVVQLARDVAAGRVRATVADIRRHLHCSQARASSLRRKLIERQLAS